MKSNVHKWSTNFCSRSMEAFLSDDDEDYDLNLEDEEKLLEEESDKKSKSENEESDILDLELAEEGIKLVFW